MQQPRTVADVLDRVAATWSGLLGVIEGLTDAQLVEPGPEGWSVKDHLAHIMVWDSAPLTIMRGQPQYRAFGLDAGAYTRIDSVDQLNAYIHERHRQRPLTDIRADLLRVHEELVAALRQLSDADLDRGIASFGGDPDDTRPLRDKIEGDTYGHYAEHTAWLRELRKAIE